MKINASITFLVGRDETRIQVHDESSSITFLEIKLTPEQLSSALSRLSQTPCESAEVFGLDKLGKQMEHQDFEFEMPEVDRSQSSKEVALVTCFTALENQGMSEWKPDGRFSSRDSFFTKDGKEYAKTTIRRWVDKTEVK